ncbi:UNVERIFIED_CONTAM: hypothetical protein FKN15_061336 [Acipenser sinensis]
MALFNTLLAGVLWQSFLRLHLPRVPVITSEKSLKKKRKRTLAAESEDDAGKKKKPQRPNYFVSIPVTNPKILTGIEAIQDAIIQKDHRFSKAMIPAGTLHITLLVTYLGNEEVNINIFEDMKSLIHSIAVSIASVNTRLNDMDKRVASNSAAIAIPPGSAFTTSTPAAVYSVITSEKSLKKKRKRTLAAESEDDAGKKKKPQRPNYFVSIPVTNPKILTGIEAIQDAIIQKDHRFSKAMIPAGTLHITLLVTYLGNEEVNMAVCAMTEMKDTLLDMLQGKELVLPFHGIGHFRSEVAFVQMAEGEHVIALTKIAETVKKSFEEKGILVTDSKAFKPHLTFMKLSRAPKLRSQGVKKLDPKLYENFEHHNFGEETVARLDLCSMQKKKQPNGYYHCEASIDFVSVSPLFGHVLLFVVLS